VKVVQVDAINGSINNVQVELKNNFVAQISVLPAIAPLLGTTTTTSTSTGTGAGTSVAISVAIGNSNGNGSGSGNGNGIATAIFAIGNSIPADTTA
jgi:hypothetical protein